MKDYERVIGDKNWNYMPMCTYRGMWAIIKYLNKKKEEKEEEKHDIAVEVHRPC